jgi:hypothetical protein
MIDFSFEFHFYSRVDATQEPIAKVKAPTRYQAALLFAKTKRLDLKSFLEVYAVSR